MRITPLSALLGLAVLTACGGTDATVESDPETPTGSAVPSAPETPTGSAVSSAPEEPTTAPWATAEPTGEVYVLDMTTFEGDDGEEVSLQRPESLTLSEFSWAQDIEWESWGGASAVGTGRLQGTFCGPGCEGEEYEVTLVLCEVADDHYRRFGVFGDFPEFDDEEWSFGGPLYIGGRPAGDDDWSNGCGEP